MKKFINYIKENRDIIEEKFLHCVDINNIDIKFDFIKYKPNLFYFNDNKLICYNNKTMKSLRYNSEPFGGSFAHIENLRDVSIKYIYQDFENIIWCANIAAQDIMKNFNV